MTPQFRLKLWIVCIVGLVVSDTAWCLAIRFANSGDDPDMTGAISTYFFLFDLIALLITTPANAIRLQVGSSIKLIAASTLWMSLLAWGLFDGRPLSGLAAIALVLATTALATAAWHAGLSPWSATIVAWSPAAIGPHALPATVVATLLLSLAILFVTLSDRRRQLTP